MGQKLKNRTSLGLFNLPTFLLTGLFCALSTVAPSSAWAVFETGATLERQTRAIPLNRLIIKYHDDAVTEQNRANLSTRILDKVAAKTGILALRHKHWMGNNAQLIDVDTNSRCQSICIGDLIKSISANPQVAYVERDRMFFPTALPNDPLLNEQWHYFGSPGSIQVDAAWAAAFPEGFDSTPSLAATVVAVIDSGSRPHRDLIDQTLPGYDFISLPNMAGDTDGRDADATDVGDHTAPQECNLFWPGSNSSWHGAHVMGTIAAATNNSIDGAGVAPNAKIVPVRALGKCGGSMADIIDGIVWAAGGSITGVPDNENPARVINLSLGAPGFCSRSMQSAISFARKAGAMVVVAAGNSGTRAALFSPANCRGAFSVAAVNAEGGRASYSNFGFNIKLAAPGGNGPNFNPPDTGVLSTIDAGLRDPVEDAMGGLVGTSMAAPHVSGVAAMVFGAQPSWTPADVEKLLVASVRPFPRRCRGCGAGLLDAGQALQSAIAAEPKTEGQPDIGNNKLPVSQLMPGIRPVSVTSTNAELKLKIEEPTDSATESNTLSETETAAEPTTEAETETETETETEHTSIPE